MSPAAISTFTWSLPAPVFTVTVSVAAGLLALAAGSPALDSDTVSSPSPVFTSMCSAPSPASMLTVSSSAVPTTVSAALATCTRFSSDR